MAKGKVKRKKPGEAARSQSQPSDFLREAPVPDRGRHAAGGSHEPARRGILYGLFSRFKRPAPHPAAGSKAPGMLVVRSHPPPSGRPAAPPPKPAAAGKSEGEKSRRQPPPNPPLLRVYRRFSGVMPRGTLNGFERSMRFAGIHPDQAPVRLGRAMLVSFITGAIPLMLYLTIFNPIATPATVSIASGLFLGGALLSAILHYLSLYFLIADRASAVEKLLPDFLSLAVSNLRAGMTPYAAFVHAARPEFGAFHEVVMAAMARVGANASIDSAFFEVASHFDSPLLHRTVTLFAKGVRSGGQLVRLLNSSADEVRRIQDLRAELISSTGTYTIFLSFTVVAIMPFLLAVSSNFVSVFISLQTDMSGISTGAAQLSSFSGKILITSDDMYNIAMLTLLVTTLLMSALIGIVERGKAIYGVKKFPLLLLLSLAAYFVAKAIIASFLSAYTV